MKLGTTTLARDARIGEPAVAAGATKRGCARRLFQPPKYEHMAAVSGAGGNPDSGAIMAKGDSLIPFWTMERFNDVEWRRE
jgi:hypothetical protein